MLFVHQAIAVEQINELSVSQLDAMTASQQRLMTTDQLMAIEQNGGTQNSKRCDVINHFSVCFVASIITCIIRKFI